MSTPKSRIHGVDMCNASEQTPHRCLGRTRRGQQCKIMVKTSQLYCHHHLRSAINVPSSGVAVPAKNGYIYVYTYQLLYDSLATDKGGARLDWLNVDNSIINNINNNHEKANKVSWDKYNKDSQFILCKIGMTTRLNVQSRLNEWESKCHHRIMNLTPQCVDVLVNVNKKKHKSLSSLFKRLSLNKSKNNTTIQLQTYHNGGFYVDISKSKLTLQQIESALHNYLWERYGKGIIHCQGCSENLKSTKRHVEWVYVPIKQLHYIFNYIDQFILYNNTKS